MNINTRQLAEDIQEDLIAAIRRLVAIESVQGPATPEAPYGVGPKKALEEALEIAKELGFETRMLDYKIGYAQLEGIESSSDEYYGIFGHVDVVPIGQGWIHDPLKGEIDHHKIYGRGVLDNKGPILANLFALYQLKEKGILFKKNIRIVFGSNEETGFGCVKHYIQKEPVPIFGWTPDCKWPVVYGERGRLKIKVIGPNQELYSFLNQWVFPSINDGSQLGIACSDQDFGALIMRGYHLEEGERESIFEWSISYPNTTNQTFLLKQIQSRLSPNLRLEVVSNWNPVLYDKDSAYVKRLQKAYNDCTGAMATPVTTTGGTYAKIIPNIIAYGPSFPNQKNIAHLPDEWVDLDDLCLNTQIYMEALLGLHEMENEK